MSRSSLLNRYDPLRFHTITAARSRRNIRLSDGGKKQSKSRNIIIPRVATTTTSLVTWWSHEGRVTHSALFNRVLHTPAGLYTPKWMRLLQVWRFNQSKTVLYFCTILFHSGPAHTFTNIFIIFSVFSSPIHTNIAIWFTKKIVVWEFLLLG